MIAFKDRHNIVKLNIECLAKQSLVPAVVLVVSNIVDYKFAIDMSCKYKNVFLTIHRNYPIGGKWDAGVKYAKKLNVNGLMILGSDDLLSLDYLKTCFHELDMGNGSNGKGVDLIGSRSWYIYDTYNKLYELEYNDKVKVTLGAGRMYSKYFLDAVGWNIFPIAQPFHLDSMGYERVVSFSNSLKIIKSEHFILCIKGNWEVINTSRNIIKSSDRISSTDVSNKISNIKGELKILDLNKYTKI